MYKSAFIRQKNFGPKALSRVSMLIEPGLIRQHRFHGLSDKPTGVSLGSIDRRLKNPPVLWVAMIWNGFILGALLLLCIIGLMK